MPKPATPEEKKLDKMVLKAMGPQRLLEPSREAMDASERMWHQRWLLQFGAVLVVLVLVVGGIFWFVYRGRAQEAARLAEQEAQTQALIETARQEVGDLIQQHKLSEASLALETASRKGLPQVVFVDLDKEIKAALATQATAEVKDLISKNQVYAAALAAQKASEKGLPHQVRQDLDKEISAALASQTGAEVKDRLSKHEYKDAEFILSKARQHGLPHEISVDIEKEIMSAARAHREELLQRAEAAIKDGDSALSEKLLADAEDLGRYAQTGNVDEARKAQGKALIQQSRAAAAEKKWDLAIELLEKARKGPREGGELERWEDDLRGLVGGRLLVQGAPDGATVRVQGQGEGKLGEVIFGLKPGDVECLVEAKGYVPDSLKARVDFPGVTTVSVKLSSAAPGPIWAVSALTGHSAQRLAAEYYLRASKKKDWEQVMRRLASPTGGKEDKAGGAAKPENLAEAIDKAMKDFGKQKKGFVRNLDKLGDFTAKTAGAAEGLLAKKEHVSAIRKYLARIESGCAFCLGEGVIPCAECKGLGKRKEMGVCLACGGQMRKTCPTCKGTTSVPCKKCHGSGTITKSRSVPGQALRKESQETCPTCHGSGKTKCTLCRDGWLACTKCKGTGQSNERRECSACGGLGSHPCDACEATGDREKMKPDRRRQAEEEAARLEGKAPAKE